MKIVVIGAGPSGLVSAKHSTANNHECDILEMRNHIGGTWLYTGETDTDEHGFPVHVATYKSLRANLPKEVMGFPDFPIPENFETYSRHFGILRFLEMYAEQFGLTPLIKFNRIVIDVRPSRNGSKWRVTSLDKIKKVECIDEYDVVMNCTGHFNEPSLPDFPGKEKFLGKQLHSRHYRTPDPFRGLRVLVVGAGPSGADIALEISSVSSKLFLSNHSKILKTEYPANVERKPDIHCIKEREVEFTDGTSCYVDVILYCTGFKYSYPYLHESCGITINDNHVQPLYKHLIHMERPTMCFIGIPLQVCAFPLFDLQARFYMKYLDGSMKLPPLEEMKNDARGDLERRLEKGFRKKEAHKMASFQCSYYKNLAELSGVEHLPPVMVKLRDKSFERFYQDLSNFRNDRYKILDDENFLHMH